MKAPKLELILTAGVGSDHIDLHAAADKGITVAEVCTSLRMQPIPSQGMSFVFAHRSSSPLRMQACSWGRLASCMACTHMS